MAEEAHQKITKDLTELKVDNKYQTEAINKISTMLEKHLEDSIPIRAQCHENASKIATMEDTKAEKTDVKWVTLGMRGIYGGAVVGIVSTLLWIIREYIKHLGS